MTWFIMIYFENDMEKVTEVTYFTEKDLLTNLKIIKDYQQISILDLFLVKSDRIHRKPEVIQLSVMEYLQQAEEL